MPDILKAGEPTESGPTGLLAPEMVSADDLDILLSWRSQCFGEHDGLSEAWHAVEFVDPEVRQGAWEAFGKVITDDNPGFAAYVSDMGQETIADSRYQTLLTFEGVLIGDAAELGALIRGIKTLDEYQGFVRTTQEIDTEDRQSPSNSAPLDIFLLGRSLNRERLFAREMRWADLTSDTVNQLLAAFGVSHLRMLGDDAINQLGIEGKLEQWYEMYNSIGHSEESHEVERLRFALFTDVFSVIRGITRRVQELNEDNPAVGRIIGLNTTMSDRESRSPKARRFLASMIWRDDTQTLEWTQNELDAWPTFPSLTQAKDKGLRDTVRH